GLAAVTQLAQGARALAPVLGDPHEQLEVHRPAHELGESGARAAADAGEHRAAGADEDLLLALALDVDRRRDARGAAAVALLPAVDADGDGVRHLLARREEDLLADV